MDDIVELIKRFDAYNMFDMIISIPDQLEEGFSIAEKVNLTGLESETFSTVILAGMGGSAIAGDLLKSLMISDIQIPFMVQRNYRLPRFVNKKTLVICSSYSGNTEETLSAFEDALASGAHLIAVSTGGQLATRAAYNKIPFIAIPEGFPPRAALGYSFSVLLSVFGRLGICGDAGSDVMVAARSLRDRNALYRPENEDNPALSLAKKIEGRISLIYGGQDSLDAVAARFKGQLCENSEALAFANQFPEFNHNEIVGLDGLGEDRRKFIAIFLRDIEDHKRIVKRFEIVGEFLRGKGIDVVELTTEPGPKILRFFTMIQLIDFCSYYLALLKGVDPYTIEAIDHLKRKLS
ncbi:MAG: bifunctional phosphoglucose/phosphomannose isomerase [Candidatus Zixiibacteriota bacterium]|nr:MAG: bifunctional phosphoglucose/phosphomannose isomerase [candidate division Zixibacteria bacterium]